MPGLSTGSPELSVPDLLVGRLQNLDLTIGMLASASRYCGAASTDQRQCHRHSRRRRASCGYAPGRAADGPASGPRGSGGRTCTSWSRSATSPSPAPAGNGPSRPYLGRKGRDDPQSQSGYAATEPAHPSRSTRASRASSARDLHRAFTHGTALCYGLGKTRENR